MSNVKKILFAAISLVLLFSLASCKKELAGVNTNLAITARRDKISVVGEFVDSEERIFSTITPTVYLYEMDGDKEGEQLQSKGMTISDGTEVGVNTTSNEVVFEDLEEETNYKVVLKATYDGYAYELDSRVVTTSLEGSSPERAISISTVEEFLNIRYDRDGYYKLENDIDFNGDSEELYSLSAMFTSSSNSFKGQINGNNFTISGFKIVSNNQYNGLVGYNEGSIVNLNIADARIESNRTSEVNTGLIAGYNNGEISNCSITNSTVYVKSTAYSLTYPLYAGIVTGTVAGENVGIKVENCKVSDSTLEVAAVHRATVGGLIGRIVAPKTIRMGQTIENNIITNTKINVSQENKTTTDDEILLNVGGFVGSTARSIENGIANVDITVRTKKSDSATFEKGLEVYKLNVGGFAGETLVNSRGANLINVAFDGSIAVTGFQKTDSEEYLENAAYETYVGGLVGSMNGIAVENGVARVSSLTINGIAEQPVAETDEEGNTTEVPTYKINYGLLIALPTEFDLVGNKVINLSTDSVNVTGDSTIITVTTDNPASSIPAEFSEFILNYFNK